MNPRYTALMASLPPLGGLFEARSPAISRLRLLNRLSLLHPDDRRVLDLTTDFLSQSIRDPALTGGPEDAALLEQARHLFQQVRNPLLRRLVAHRLDLRTIVAALRRRHRGESEPPRGEPWGFGPWVAPIERRWSEPAFALEAVFPWIPELSGLLEAGDLVGIERLLFAEIWRETDRIALGHHFDFEAVLIYLARWSLVERWSNYDTPAASQRFRQLVADGLGRFSDITSATAPR